MKKVLLSFAMLLVAGAGFAQCCKSAYEVKAENAYTNYNVRYASNPMDAKHIQQTVFVVSLPSRRFLLQVR